MNMRKTRRTGAGPAKVSSRCAWLLGALWAVLVAWGYVINVDPRVHSWNMLESDCPHPLLLRLRGRKKSRRMIVSIWNLFHAYIYLCVAFTLCVAYPPRDVGKIVLGLVAFGAAFEVVEIPFGVHDWTDVLYNSAGIALGVLLSRACVSPRERHLLSDQRSRVLRLLGLLLLLGVFRLWDEWQRQ